MKNHLIFFVFTFLFGPVIFAQDSAIKLGSSNNSERVKNIQQYSEKVEYYLDKNLDSCRMYSTQLMTLSERGTNDERFHAFFLMSKLYNELNAFLLSSKYLDKAKSELLLIENNELDLADLCNDYGLLYFKQGRFTEAKDWFEKSLEIENKVARDGRDIMAKSNLGTIEEKLGNFNGALRLYKECELRYMRESNSEKRLANLYNRMGGMFLDNDSLASAKTCFLKADSIYKSIGTNSGHAHSVTNIAIVDFIEGDLEKSLEGFGKALEIRRNYGQLQFVSESYLNLGDFYRRTKDYEKAAQYLNNAYDIAVKANSVEALKDAKEYLLTLYKELEDNESTVLVLLRFNEDFEMITRNNLDLQIKDLDFFNQLDRSDEVYSKEQAIDKKKAKDNNSWLMITLVAFVAFQFIIILVLMVRKRSN